MESALVDPTLLAQHLDDPAWVIIDCRFTLADTELGKKSYLAWHIPGAVYAHLDDDLSGTIIAGETGRHPLPDIDVFADRLSSWGIDGRVQVVAYDDAGGDIAARLWWMLQWLGHTNAAVLDGGWKEWKRLGLPVSSKVPYPVRREFMVKHRPELLVDSEVVASMANHPGYILVDVRDPERYRGDVEPIDSKAGHIPGAINLPYKGNLDADGSFLPRETLRKRYESILKGKSAEQAVFYCGSGVTAAHSLLALAHAGLGEGKLYADSWSGWIADAAREIIRGEKDAKSE